MRTARRSLTVAIAIATSLGAVAAGGAVAAQLTVTGDIGTNSVSATCQSSTMSVGFTTPFDTSIPGYKISSVELGNIDSGCYGKTVQLRLTAANGTTIYGQGTGTLPAAASGSIPLDTAYSLPDNSWLITRIILTVVS